MGLPDSFIKHLFELLDEAIEAMRRVKNYGLADRLRNIKGQLADIYSVGGGRV